MTDEDQAGRTAEQGGTAVTEQTRPAEPGETDTTRFGFAAEGDAPLGETPTPGAGKHEEPRGGLATGLQPGGVIPGGGPGATVGSIGTGGGSNADRATGDSNENTIEEDVR